jgi:homoserine kinase type II
VDVRQTNELLELAKNLVAETGRLRDALQWEFLAGQVLEIFATDYDLGEVVRVEQVFGGFENLSFAVRTRCVDGERRYFVRKYKHGTSEREIRYEHALVRHIRRKGFDLAARVFETDSGDTVVTREELLDGEQVSRYFAVYEILDGENKYSWVKNRCTDAEFQDAGRMLARFHYAAYEFESGDLVREQPPIMDFLATLPDTFRRLAQRSTGTKFEAFLVAELPGILESIDRGLALAPELEELPRCPVFCDYHPGNHKWVDEHSVGLFDFDWAKLDYRLFDVAVGLVYFCSSWEGPDDGEVRLDKVELLLKAYRDEAARYDAPGPLTDAELAALPRMMAIAAMYVVNWDIVAYYKEASPNDDEYLFFLEHNVAFVKYIESHLQELGAITVSAGGVAATRAGAPSGVLAAGPVSESEESV